MSLRLLASAAFAATALGAATAAEPDYYYRLGGHVFGPVAPGGGGGDTDVPDDDEDTDNPDDTTPPGTTPALDDTETGYGSSVKFLAVNENSGTIVLSGKDYDLQSLAWDVEGISTSTDESWVTHIASSSDSGRRIVLKKSGCGTIMTIVPGADRSHWNFTAAYDPTTYGCYGTMPLLGMKLVDSKGAVDRWTSSYVFDTNRPSGSGDLWLKAVDNVPFDASNEGLGTLVVEDNEGEAVTTVFDPYYDGKSVTCGVDGTGTCLFDVNGAAMTVDIRMRGRPGSTRVSYAISKTTDTDWKVLATQTGSYRIASTTLPGMTAEDASGRTGTWKPTKFGFQVDDENENPVKPEIVASGSPLPSTIAVDGGSTNYEQPRTYGPFAEGLIIKSRSKQLFYRFKERNDDFFLDVGNRIDDDVPGGCISDYYLGMRFPALARDSFLKCFRGSNSFREGPLTRGMFVANLDEETETDQINPVGGYFYEAKLEDADNTYDGLSGSVEGIGWSVIRPYMIQDGFYYYDASFTIRMARGHDQRYGNDNCVYESVRNATGNSMMTLDMSEVSREGSHVLQVITNRVSNGPSIVTTRAAEGSLCE